MYQQRSLHIYKGRINWIPMSSKKIDNVYDWFVDDVLEKITHAEITRLLHSINNMLDHVKKTFSIEEKTILLCKLFKIYLNQNKLHTDRQIEHHIKTYDVMSTFSMYLRGCSFKTYNKAVVETELHIL